MKKYVILIREIILKNIMLYTLKSAIYFKLWNTIQSYTLKRKTRSAFYTYSFESWTEFRTKTNTNHS